MLVITGPVVRGDASQKCPPSRGGLHLLLFSTAIGVFAQPTLTASPTHCLHPFFLVHGGCPPASITQKRPNHGQVSVHGEPKFIEGQQPYVQQLRGCDPAPKCTKGLVTVGCGFAIIPVVGVMTQDESKIKGTLVTTLYIFIYIYRNQTNKQVTTAKDLLGYHKNLQLSGNH